MKNTAFLIDDESNCTDALRVLLERHCPAITVSGIFNDAEQAAAALEQGHPELVFLDIEMPRLNGFELLRRCARLDFKVIFTTAYDQYAIRAFKFNALDYLLKPIDKDELIAAVQKALVSNVPHSLQLEAAQLLQRQPVPERIALPVGQELLFVEVADIQYCASDGSYSSFYFGKSGAKPILVSKSLREIEELLNNPTVFFRCHNSYLVNLRCIKKIIRTDGGDIVLQNGQSIPVARAKKADLLRVIAKL
ncbi:MAG: response regulator [Saprospiraceae bacterium]|nr:response regulator [Saprospiraceae bacterium]